MNISTARAPRGRAADGGPSAVMRIAVVTIAIICAVGFMYFASAFLVPVFLSIFLAMLIDPFVEFAVMRGAKRKPITYLVVGIMTIILGAFGWAAFYSARELVTGTINSPRLMEIAEILKHRAGSFGDSFTGFSAVFSQNPAVPKVEVIEPYPIWLRWVISAFGSFFEIVSLAIFVPMLLFYLLYDKENLTESFNALIGRYVYLPTLTADLPHMVRSFFRANLITAALIICCECVVFYILGFTNWFTLALTSGSINVVPVVGAPVAVAITLTAGTMKDGTEFPFILAPILVVAIHFILTNFVMPMLMGARSNVNTAALIAGSLFWSWTWGAVGFFISVPMTMLVKILLESNTATLPIANLMAARPTTLVPFLNEGEVVDSTF